MRDAVGFWNSGAVVDRRQGRWLRRGRTDELLQKTDVEDVVQTGARR